MGIWLALMLAGAGQAGAESGLLRGFAGSALEDTIRAVDPTLIMIPGSAGMSALSAMRVRESARIGVARQAAVVHLRMLTPEEAAASKALYLALNGEHEGPGEARVGERVPCRKSVHDGRASFSCSDLQSLDHGALFEALRAPAEPFEGQPHIQVKNVAGLGCCLRFGSAQTERAPEPSRNPVDRWLRPERSAGQTAGPSHLCQFAAM